MLQRHLHQCNIHGANNSHSENATDILKEYHANIGGTPEYDPAPKKKGPKAGTKRSSKAANLDSPQITSSSKKAKRKSGADTTPNGTTEIDPKDLPEGSWENLVRVSSILEEPAAAVKGSKQKHGNMLLALLLWHGGRKTQHTLDVARRKCPQRLLDYYEQHL
jgi:chromobox protein 1